MVVEGGDAALLHFTREPVTRATAPEKSGSWPTSIDLAAARGQLERVEVSTGEPVVLLDRAVE